MSRNHGLDGLRAIAISLVVVGHVVLWPGGGKGVDLFFVLSGFLITTLLVEEHGRTGKISLHGFYARRVRRLLPALAVVVMATACAVAVFHSHDLRQIAVSAVLGIGFVMNFTASDIVQHGPSTTFFQLWSLAAEEQFYLLWPLVLIVLIRWPRALMVLLVALVVVMTLRSVELHGNPDGNRVAFGPDTRPVGLPIGCLLALAWWLYRDRVKRIAGLLFPVAVLVMVLCVLPNVPDIYTGWTLAFTIATAVVLICALDGRTAAAVGWRPVAYLGKISYSFYLWHFPLMVGVGWAAATITSRALAALVAILLSVASYHLVEQPFRDRRARRVELAPAAA